jgi:hypothetical protein
VGQQVANSAPKSGHLWPDTFLSRRVAEKSRDFRFVLFDSFQWKSERKRFSLPPTKNYLWLLRKFIAETFHSQT